MITGSSRVEATELWRMSATELAGVIRSRQVSVREVVEAHLRRILLTYAHYYNEARTHRSLNKDAPLHRAIQRLGAITSQPVLGGLHHQYCRI